MKKLLVFCFLWLTVGFVTGTATLMGPVRWITGHGRLEGWSDGAETSIIRAVILAYVLASALVAAWMARIVLKTTRVHVRLGVPALALVAAAAHLVLWLSPALMGGGLGAETDAGSLFTFGPYPTQHRLDRLHDEGYTAVISLLHPAVVPFETKLIRDGKAAARAAGLEYLHVPMLPWVSENSEALERIRQIVTRGEGRYYVHCYLGKDRIRVVKRFVQELDPSARIESTRKLQRHEDARRLADGSVMKRGTVVEVAQGVYLTPYPTDHEYVSYIVPGTHGHVVSLLDPNRDGDWIDRERRLLEGNGLTYSLRPIPVAPYDPRRALEVAREISSLPRPMNVHAFLGPDSGRAPAAEALLQALRSNLPPLPPALFDEPMAGGPVTVIGPNVAVGPRPEGPEFGAYLHRRGIREWVYLGDPVSEVAREDEAICASADLDLHWRAVEPETDVASLVATGGPWYLYGPGLASVQDELAGRLGPALPQQMRWNPWPTEASNPEAKPAPESASLLERATPDLRSSILLPPLFLLAAAAAAAFVGWLRTVKQVAAPYTRKIFHFLIFTAAGGLHLLGGLSHVILFGSVVTGLVLYAVWRGNGFPFYEAMARPTDAPQRTLFILVPLMTTAVGGIAANLFFGAFAYVGYLVAGWGDAIAEPVGTAWGRHRYRVPSLAGVAAQRSLEGSASVLLVGALAAFLGLWLNGTPLPSAAGIALACGLAAAVVEAFSNHGLDNLTVQLAASGTAFLLLT